IEQYMSAKPCPVCHGARLKKEVLAVTVGNRSIIDIGNLSIINAQRFFEALVAAAGGDGASDGATAGATYPEPAPSNGAGLEIAKNGKNGTNGKSSNGQAARRGRLRVVRGDISLDDVTPLTPRERVIARQILKEIQARLGFLVDVGLDYLSINRSANTLSGG